MKKLLCLTLALTLCIFSVGFVYADSEESLQNDTKSVAEDNISQTQVLDKEYTVSQLSVQPRYVVLANLTAETLDVWPAQNVDTIARFNTNVEQSGIAGWYGTISGRSFTKCYKTCDSIKNKETFSFIGLSVAISGGGFSVSPSGNSASSSATVRNAKQQLHEFNGLNFSGVELQVTETLMATFTKGTTSFTSTASDSAWL